MAARSRRANTVPPPDPRRHTHGHHQAADGLPKVLLRGNGECGKDFVSYSGDGDLFWCGLVIFFVCELFVFSGLYFFVVL